MIRETEYIATIGKAKEEDDNLINCEDVRLDPDLDRLSKKNFIPIVRSKEYPYDAPLVHGQVNTPQYRQ